MAQSTPTTALHPYLTPSRLPTVRGNHLHGSWGFLFRPILTRDLIFNFSITFGGSGRGRRVTSMLNNDWDKWKCGIAKLIKKSGIARPQLSIFFYVFPLQTPWNQVGECEKLKLVENGPIGRHTMQPYPPKKATF